MKSSNNLWNSTLNTAENYTYILQHSIRSCRASEREGENSSRELSWERKKLSRERTESEKCVERGKFSAANFSSLDRLTSVRYVEVERLKKKRCRGNILCFYEGKSSDFLIKLKADKNYAKVRKFRNLWKSQKNKLKCEHTRGVEKLANVLNGLKHKNNNFEVWLIKQKFSNISLGSSAKLSLNEISEN